MELGCSAVNATFISGFPENIQLDCQWLLFVLRSADRFYNVLVCLRSSELAIMMSIGSHSGLYHPAKPSPSLSALGKSTHEKKKKAPRTKEMTELRIFLSIWYTINLELTEIRRVISIIPYRTTPGLSCSTFVNLLMHTVIAELHLPAPNVGSRKNMITKIDKKEGKPNRYVKYASQCI